MNFYPFFYPTMSWINKRGFQEYDLKKSLLDETTQTFGLKILGLLSYSRNQFCTHIGRMYRETASISLSSWPSTFLGVITPSKELCTTFYDIGNTILYLHKRKLTKVSYTVRKL